MLLIAYCGELVVSLVRQAYPREQGMALAVFKNADERGLYNRPHGFRGTCDCLNLNRAKAVAVVLSQSTRIRCLGSKDHILRSL